MIIPYKLNQVAIIQIHYIITHYYIYNTFTNIFFTYSITLLFIISSYSITSIITFTSHLIITFLIPFFQFYVQRYKLSYFCSTYAKNLNSIFSSPISYHDIIFFQYSNFCVGYAPCSKILKNSFTPQQNSQNFFNLHKNPNKIQKLDEDKDESDNSAGGDIVDGEIDLGADNDTVGGQLPNFFSFFFSKNAQIFKKNQTEPTLGWPNLALFYIIIFTYWKAIIEFNTWKWLISVNWFQSDEN